MASGSHELRTPISVLGAAGKNLADAQVEDPVQLRAYGRVIQDETQRLNENILHLARKHAPAPRMTRTRLDLAQLVLEALQRAQRQIDQAAFEVETDITRPPLPIFGNSRALQAAVLNLISNALNYGRGAGWLRISVAIDPDSSRKALIVVENRDPAARIERVDGAVPKQVFPGSYASAIVGG